MNHIIYNEKIITPASDKQKYYYDFTNKLNKKDCVKLGLFCAKINNNNNSKESNDCIELIEKWLKDKNSIKLKELNAAADANYPSAYLAMSVYSTAGITAYVATYTAYSISATNSSASVNAAAVSAAIYSISNTAKINQYLQILLRKTKQFQNNKILEQISKTDVDKLELVDWNMITDIMQEEYNIVHEFSYEDIFSRRCLIELLRREYT